MARVIITATTYNDPNKILDFIKKNADAMAAEINQRLAKIQYDRAKQIAKSAVDAFYGSYGPRSYGRTFDLYNAYDIGISNGEDFVFELGPDLMSGHHQGPAFVYENSFVGGYHGGSAGTDNNGISVGSPWWRTPPFFDSWLAPAPQSESPYDRIVSQWNAFIDGEYPGIKASIVGAVASKYSSMYRG